MQSTYELTAQEEERAAEAAVYVGKPDMRPSWDGGGWGGPRDGHDKDQRYMLRGEETWTLNLLKFCSSFFGPLRPLFDFFGGL